MLGFLSFFYSMSLAFAVSCDPGPCVPPVCTPVAPATTCLSSCVYTACTPASNSVAITVDKLPYTMTVPADSCAPGEFTPNPISLITSTVNGTAITKIPQALSIAYSTCVNATVTKSYP